jgi:hypothetical protein
MTNEQACRLARYANTLGPGIGAIPTKNEGGWCILLWLDLAISGKSAIVDEFTQTAVQSAIEELWDSELNPTKKGKTECLVKQDLSLAQKPALLRKTVTFKPSKCRPTFGQSKT